MCIKERKEGKEGRKEGRKGGKDFHPLTCSTCAFPVSLQVGADLGYISQSQRRAVLPADLIQGSGLSWGVSEQC